jgi:hypothetical protein
MKDSLGTTRYTYKQPGALQRYGEDGPRTNDALYYAYNALDALGRPRRRCNGRKARPSTP